MSKTTSSPKNIAEEIYKIGYIQNYKALELIKLKNNEPDALQYVINQFKKIYNYTIYMYIMNL
jgi:hypothetical protein